eukprot:COSAG01_NODE_5466_length_4243_cov_77.924469_6_plen_147_part_00
MAVAALVLIMKYLRRRLQRPERQLRHGHAAHDRRVIRVWRLPDSQNEQHLQSKRPPIKSRWVSQPPVSAGELQPRRFNNQSMPHPLRRGWRRPQPLRHSAAAAAGAAIHHQHARRFCQATDHDQKRRRRLRFPYVSIHFIFVSCVA